MKADIHLHSSYSIDSLEKMQNYCDEALAKQIDIICFTDHVECEEKGKWYTYGKFDFDGQLKEYTILKNKYAELGLKVLLGIEFGEPHLYPDILEKMHKKNFDYIIGSVHTAYDKFAQSNGTMSVEKLYEMHYRESVKMAEFGGFDTLAHLDFPKKMGSGFIYDEASTVKILKSIIKNDISLEFNTSPLRANLFETSPSVALAKMYQDFGGRKVTVSSDSHTATSVGDGITQTIFNLPKTLDIGYYENRKFIKL